MITQRMVKGSIPPFANFLYYLTIYTFAFFQNSTQLLSVASIIVLSLAVTAKFAITKRFIISQVGKIQKRNIPTDLFLWLFPNLLLLVFSLPTSSALKGQFYLGQIPPNVWHNSTTIFLMPFALMLFWLSYRQILEPKKTRILPITILSILNLIIKPSFYFVFAFIYPLMLLRFIGIKKEFWLNLLPIIIGSTILAGEYYYIYKVIGPVLGTSSIAIRPFVVWSHYSSNIIFSIIASTLFPLVYLIFNWKTIFRDVLLGYAMLLYLVSILLFSTLTEIGQRQYAENFAWQYIICNYILFMVVSIRFIQQVVSIAKVNWPNKLVLTSFLLHVLSGVLYLIKVFIAKSYC